MEILKIIGLVLLSELIILYIINILRLYNQAIPGWAVFNPFTNPNDFYPSHEWIKGNQAAKEEISKLKSQIIDSNKKLLESYIELSESLKLRIEMHDDIMEVVMEQLKRLARDN